jgi:hypothetical protein
MCPAGLAAYGHVAEPIRQASRHTVCALVAAAKRLGVFLNLFTPLSSLPLPLHYRLKASTLFLEGYNHRFFASRALDPRFLAAAGSHHTSTRSKSFIEAQSVPSPPSFH